MNDCLVNFRNGTDFAEDFGDVDLGMLIYAVRKSEIFDGHPESLTSEQIGSAACLVLEKHIATPDSNRYYQTVFENMMAFYCDVIPNHSKQKDVLGASMCDFSLLQFELESQIVHYFEYFILQQFEILERMRGEMPLDSP